MRKASAFPETHLSRIQICNDIVLSESETLAESADFRQTAEAQSASHQHESPTY